MNRWICFLLSCFFISPTFARDYEWMPDRRKDQFPIEPAHLFVPLPYSYPGIGDGFFLIANMSNMAGSTADGVAIGVVGDATGAVIQGDEIPLIDKQLLLSVHLRDIDRAIVNNYEIRGMNGSDDYNLLDVTRADESRFELKYTTYDRRLNFLAIYNTNRFALDAIRDKNGDIIQQLDEPYTGEDSSTSLAVNLDFTDDYLDPRSGFRFELSYADVNAQDDDGPEYYRLDYNALFYIPYSQNDVLVVNYYQSDAHVEKIGNTNPLDIQADLNLQCGTDPACLNVEQQLIQSTISANTNGTATSLGGLNRLRAYPQGRFQGGRMAFVGVEYRWNMVDENTPFNYLFWKDVRTGKQIAFFAEAGSVAETSAELWDEYRNSVGVGFRLVTASGSVYRADIAYGDEGTETAIFFFYPW